MPRAPAVAPRRRWRALALSVALALAPTLAPDSARAWDPSTTHLGLTDRAAIESAAHLRWMAGSEFQRGLFTTLRVDPDRLKRDEWRLFMQTASSAHASSGVRPLGGPGACPGADAPPTTTRYCVQGDLWQLTAIQWMEFGVLAELVPSAREVHHFVDPEDPTAPRWRSRGESLSPVVLRSRQSRHNGASTAARLTRTGFSGDGPSAAAWLASDEDPLAPARLFEHLELAYLSAEPEVREHHFALALVCTGALLHVGQDLALPAHARADVAAFFRNLSSHRADRGLPLQELARLRFGRSDLPIARDAAAIARARGVPLAANIEEHLLGRYLDGGDGVARHAAARFLSSGTLPAPAALDPELSDTAAAAKLIEGGGLDPVELEGARLSPWPAERGYLLSGAGRPLLAFTTDEDGFIRAYLDDAVYDDQLAQLLPRALDVSRSLLDTIFSTWPNIQVRMTAGTLEFTLGEQYESPELLVLTQAADGARAIKLKVALLPGKRNRVRGLPVNELGEDGRVVLVLRATRKGGGDPVLLEHVLAPDTTEITPMPAPAKPTADAS